MTLGSQQSIQARATAAFIFAGFVISLTVNLPGHLSYDSVIELLEGRTGVYAGWHPPVTSWLLGVYDAILPGAALFVLMNTLFIFGALYALFRLMPQATWASAVLAVMFALTPQYLIYPGIVWKDVLFASSTLFAFVSLTVAAADWNETRARDVWLGVSLILFVLGALARQNGIVMLVTGAVAFGWIAAQASDTKWRTFILRGGAALIAGAILVTTANIALGTRINNISGPARQFKLLQVYDTIAMLSSNPKMPLDVLDAQAPQLSHEMRTDGLKLYTPARNDPLAGSQPLQDAIGDAPDGVIQSQWIHLIEEHPGLYIATRADLFYWVFLTPRIDLCLPFSVGIAGPQSALDDLDLESRWDDRDVALELYGDSFYGTPVFQHGIFALFALGAAIILFRRRRLPDIAVGMLQVGAMLFGLTYFFISIACDYRYMYALDLAAMTGWFYLALDWRWPEAMLARWRPAA